MGNEGEGATGRRRPNSLSGAVTESPPGPQEHRSRARSKEQTPRGTSGPERGPESNRHATIADLKANAERRQQRDRQLDLSSGSLVFSSGALDSPMKCCTLAWAPSILSMSVQSSVVAGELGVGGVGRGEGEDEVEGSDGGERKRA